MEQQQHMFTNRMIRNLLIPVVLEQLLNSIMEMVIGPLVLSCARKIDAAESYAAINGKDRAV